MQVDKRNADGKRSLKALRKEMKESEKGYVFRQGQTWIIRRKGEGCYYESPAPYWADERDAIEMLLGLDLSRYGF